MRTSRKILDTNEAILTESGRRERESLKEYFVLSEKAVQPPVELDSIESDALVAKGKLILCLKSIEDSEGQIKARLVAMGNVLFDSTCPFGVTQHLHDLWSPVASTAEARIVPARAGGVRTSDREHRFDCCIPTGGDGSRNQALQIILECLRRVMPPEEKALFDKLRRPCVSAKELCAVLPGLV